MNEYMICTIRQFLFGFAWVSCHYSFATTKITEFIMSKTVLVLGSSGRFGRHACACFQSAGWQLRRFRRDGQNLKEAARGVDVIVNGWNPAYPDWQRQVPALTAQVIAAAKTAGATVIVPGNIYVYGKGAPAVLRADTPHAATNPLGRVRRTMEETLRASGVRCILLRAGDFIDTRPSGNWFDKVMTAKLAKGNFIYPGPADCPHGWAFLPDLAQVAVDLAERRAQLARFEDIGFGGYSVSGQEMAQALSAVCGREIALRRLNWLPFRALSPVAPMLRHLCEMRYLWAMPHRIDESRLREILPRYAITPLPGALRQALGGMEESQGSGWTA